MRRTNGECKFNFTFQKCNNHIGFYVPFIASLVFCPLYWSMWDKAKEANIEALNRNPDKFKDYPFYETCGMGNETDYVEGPMLILEFASIFYLLYMILMCCLMCCHCYDIGCT